MKRIGVLLFNVIVVRLEIRRSKSVSLGLYATCLFCLFAGELKDKRDLPSQEVSLSIWL